MSVTKRAALAALMAASTVPAVAQAAPNPHQVYVLPDSYGVDMESSTYSAGRTLTQVFAERGWKAIVHGRGGRGIGGSPTPNGLQQAVKDRALIASSSTVVVELGTNTSPDGSYFPTRAMTLLKTIRGYQPAARILWVLPANGVTTVSYQAALQRNRNTILGLAGVTPVRWDLAERASTGSASFIGSPWFSRADAFKHPRVDGPDPDKRADGYDTLKSLIVDAVTG